MFTLARSCNAAKTTEPMLHLARSHLPYRPCKKKPLALGSPWTPRLFAEHQVRLPRVQSFPVDFVSIRNAVFSPPQKKKKETKRTQRHVDMTRLVNPTSHVLHDSHLPLGGTYNLVRSLPWLFSSDRLLANWEATRGPSLARRPNHRASSLFVPHHRTCRPVFCLLKRGTNDLAGPKSFFLGVVFGPRG